MLLVHIKSFLSNKKIPCIPALIYNNQFVVDFKEKVNCLTHSLQSNALILRPEAVYLPNYCVEQINP